MKATFKFYELEEDESQIVPHVDVSASQEIALSQTQVSECHSTRDVYLALYCKAEIAAQELARAIGEAFAFHLDEWDDPEDVWRVPCPA